MTPLLAVTIQEMRMTTKMRSTVGKIVTLAAALTTAAYVTACADGSPSGPSGGSSGSSGSSSGTSNPNAPMPGRYQLRTVNGATVPGVFDSFSPAPGYLMEMSAEFGYIILNEDNTYLHEVKTSLTRPSLPPLEKDEQTVGIWAGTATSLTLTPYQSSPYSPSINGNTITIVTEVPGIGGTTDKISWVYRK
jgi:hypothetical protein